MYNVYCTLYIVHIVYELYLTHVKFNTNVSDVILQWQNTLHWTVSVDSHVHCTLQWASDHLRTIHHVTFNTDVVQWNFTITLQLHSEHLNIVPICDNQKGKLRKAPQRVLHFTEAKSQNCKQTSSSTEQT